MKKPLILMSVLLFLIASAVHAQVTKTNTQFPNPGFEKWKNHNCSTDGGTNAEWVPYNWHTFDEANASWAISLAGGTKNHHHSVNYSNSTSQQFILTTENTTNSTKYIGIICRSIASKKANGALSSGQTKIALSTNPQNNGNYNFTNPDATSSYSTSGYFTWAFVGCPDSMSFYYRTNMQKAAVQPLFKVYIHEAGEFRDRADGTLYGGSSTRLIGSSVDTFNQSSTWKREVHPFSYSHPGSTTGSAFNFIGQTDRPTHPTYGYYTTLNRPTYMLASFSTDKTAGEENQSVNDALYVDELWCIYDKGLASLTIGGTANSDALNTFNAAEYATHEPSRTYDANGNPTFNNGGSVTWTYPTPIPCNNIPQVFATPRSKLISQFTIMPAVPQNGYKATIYVKHNDNSEFYYYIQFTPALPNITLNNNGIYTACEGDDITVTASGASSYSWSNGLGSGATVHPTASGVYTVTGTANGCTSTATATVTVNQPTTGDTTATACESFDWYNHSNITESCSNLTHTLAGANINGCDSIVTLLLTINYGTHNAETESADESFTWHGTTYSTSGVYTYEYNNADGCASTDTLHLTINQGTQSTQEIALAAGTNWVSFNVETNLNDLKAALVATGNTAITIQGQSQNATYNPNNSRWTGQLRVLDLSQMYKIKVADACEITLEGTPVDPSMYPVTIAPGVNYIAYPFNTNMTVTDAFAGFGVNGDVVQSQLQNANFNGSRWIGQLRNLEPGKGYVYKSASTETRVFNYPTSR